MADTQYLEIQTLKLKECMRVLNNTNLCWKNVKDGEMYCHKKETNCIPLYNCLIKLHFSTFDE